MLIVILLLSLLSIFGMPPTFFEKGVVIKSVDSNSTAFEQGLKQGQVITAIDGKQITNQLDYTNALAGKFISNESTKLTITTQNSEAILFSNSPPKITVSDVSKTNVKLGLDLAGGARALVKAQDFDLSATNAQNLAGVIKNRLNVYGIEDIQIGPVSDLSGNNFVRIEIAGATPDDLQNLISQQGKFEAKIGNDTVFVGSNKDITNVAQDTVIDNCQQSSTGYFCNFRFTIFLSQDAAKRQSDLTRNLQTNYTSSNGQNYLSKKLDLYLDDKLVDSLSISDSLKGVVTTQISISGSGAGQTQNDAIKSAQESAKRLQTILITGSLPYKLEIVKLDTLSPTLGKQFVNSILLAGLASSLAVVIIIFAKYRKFRESMAVLITSLSEVIIILGIASLVRWNLDLPSIAGILTTIGTGVDQQIIVLDEAAEKTINIVQRMKRAFAIILGAFFASFVAMVPLYWAAAGFFKGFAITTIIGITAGVLITRPAFTDMVKMIEG